MDLLDFYWLLQQKNNTVDFTPYSTIKEKVKK